MPPNTRVMASGWGALNFDNPSSPQILQKLDMTIISNMECSRAHSNRIYPGQICVLKGQGSGVCVVSYEIFIAIHIYILEFKTMAKLFLLINRVTAVVP